MQDKLQTVVTIIADSNFVTPVYILVLSLKEFQPAQRIHILGISLSDEEKALFTQFDHVFVFDSSIPRSETPGAMRIIADILKGEALLTAKDCQEPWVALLDGDCIATGDIRPCLEPDTPALYARSRSAEEDDRIFKYYRDSSDSRQKGIPARFLQQWQKDVGQRETPARRTTVLSGNLILHRDYLGFAGDWTQFMKQVLDHENPAQTHLAYYMPAEFALSAWLMFANDPPPVREVQLNSNPQAYLAHLGPAPKYWHLWTLKNLQYFDQIMSLLDRAGSQGFNIPRLPYALKNRNKFFIVFVAFAQRFMYLVRRQMKRAYAGIAGNSPDRQARRYGRQKV